MSPLTFIWQARNLPWRISVLAIEFEIEKDWMSNYPKKGAKNSQDILGTNGRERSGAEMHLR